jgi:hypothetical protein
MVTPAGIETLLIISALKLTVNKIVKLLNPYNSYLATIQKYELWGIKTNRRREKFNLYSRFYQFLMK